MARYIDVEALGIGKAKRNWFTVPQYADGWNDEIDVIEKAPTADVAEVKHGEWKKQKKRASWDCSVCGHTVGAYLAGCAYYCPNCGTKMDGKDG